jgi:riboflavin biosynthesis pyrimidine reductase
VLHLAPALSGGSDGLGVFEGAGIATMADLWRGHIVSTQQLGDDIEIVIEPNLKAPNLNIKENKNESVS